MTIEAGVDIVIDEARENGYFDEDDNRLVLISVSSQNEDKSKELEVNINLSLEEKEITREIKNIEVVNFNKVAYEEAKSLNISPGKMKLIENAIEQNHELIKEELIDDSVQDNINEIKKVKENINNKKNEHNSAENKNENEKNNKNREEDGKEVKSNNGNEGNVKNNSENKNGLNIVIEDDKNDKSINVELSVKKNDLDDVSIVEPEERSEGDSMQNQNNKNVSGGVDIEFNKKDKGIEDEINIDIDGKVTDGLDILNEVDLEIDINKDDGLSIGFDFNRKKP